MIYKEKTNPDQSYDSWYQVKIQGGPTKRQIPATQMQVNYQFYGEDYPLIVLDNWAIKPFLLYISSLFE